MQCGSEVTWTTGVGIALLIVLGAWFLTVVPRGERKVERMGKAKKKNSRLNGNVDT